MRPPGAFGIARARPLIVFLSLLAITFLITIGAMILSFQHEEVLRQAVFGSNNARTSSQRLFSLVQDAEIRQRNYLLTDDPKDLSTYQIARRNIDRAQLSAVKDVKDDAALKSDFSRLQGAINDKLKDLADAIDLKNKTRPEVVRAFLMDARGRNDGSAIRQDMAQLTAHEDAKLVDHRRRASDFRLERDVLTIAGLVAVTLVMVWALWRDDRQRRSQTALLDQINEVAQRQRAIFDSAMDSIITLNPSGSVESVNAAGLRMLGYSEDELLRRDVSAFIDMTPKRFRTFLEKISSPLQIETGVRRELIAKHKSGLEIPVDVSIRAMRLLDGVHLVAIARDASERREMESMKDNFVATVSHELRTPLTSIAGSLALLKGGAGGPLPKRASRLVEIAESNSARLVRLINDILDIEKIRSGAAAFEKRPIFLRDLAQLACEAMSGMAFDRGVEIAITPTSESVCVAADHDRMMQVMTNLLSNAIKVSKAGDQIDISVYIHKGVGRIAVTDQGPGVSPEFAAKIFERFAQADETDRRPLGGTGLGLAIVREIVVGHDGVVGFENNRGPGATFFVDLPLMEAATTPEEDHTDEIPSILICEDDELIAEVLSEHLKGLGYRPEIVASANAARHVLHTGRFEAMLLDIRLPDSDGVTLMRALRAAPATATLPIIAMSGSLEHKSEAEALGIVDWLTKPIRLEQIESVLKIALQPRRTKPALILHVEDDRDLVEIARSRLGGLGEVVNARTLESARMLLRERRPDLIILDLGLPDGSGELFVDHIRRSPRPVPTIIYSAQDLVDLPSAPIEAVLVKSRSDLEKLARVAKRLLEKAADDKD